MHCAKHSARHANSTMCTLRVVRMKTTLLSRLGMALVLLRAESALKLRIQGRSSLHLRLPNRDYSDSIEVVPIGALGKMEVLRYRRQRPINMNFTFQICVSQGL